MEDWEIGEDREKWCLTSKNEVNQKKYLPTYLRKEAKVGKCIKMLVGNMEKIKRNRETYGKITWKRKKKRGKSQGEDGKVKRRVKND